MTLAGYHKHLRFGWISPRAFEFISVANGDDNTHIKEKKYVEITFPFAKYTFQKVNLYNVRSEGKCMNVAIKNKSIITP